MEGNSGFAMIAPMKLREALVRRADRSSLILFFDLMNERIKTLHRRERLTMKQVGKQIGLSESRVSQMHSNCLKRIERSIER